MTKRVALTVLLPYLYLGIISTVIKRRVGTKYHFNLKPFWTIKTILSDGREKAWLLKEVILNILMLMPVGLMAPVLYKKRKIVKTLFLGIGISLLIEAFQLIEHRGLAEIDDVIFNTLGVLIGLGIYSIVKR